jgi:tetratricopeptide (TPR) repeat protein
MKYLFLSLLVFYSTDIICQTKTDSLLLLLDATIQKTSQYDVDKTNEINILKQALKKTKDSDLKSRFVIYNKLFEEYRAYNYDSAYFYTKKMLTIGEMLHNPYMKATANLNFGFILLSSGMFKEALEVLTTIHIKSLPDSLHANYYSLLGRYYYDLSEYNYYNDYSIDYKEKAGKYIDSSLGLYPKNDFAYLYFLGLKNLKTGNADSAFAAFKHIIDSMPGISFHNYALATSTLSGLYFKEKKNEDAINFLLEAAIADIKSSTKENTASLNVSRLLFEKGDTRNAMMCIKKANDDAQFYGARQRKLQIGAIFPIIEGQVINIINVQKKTLEHYLLIVSALFLLLIILTVIIYKQLKKLKLAKDIIYNAHVKEIEINHLLNEANTIKEQFNQQLKASNYQLQESNKIKEEYIGYFFHIDYQLLKKFEKFKSSIEKKLNERKLDEIRFLIQNTNLKQEKEDLLDSFDKTFIKLFPNFVKEFNSLFSTENQIILKDKNVLNTELRIFALIRIGISDNEKIAQILNYSVNTIYTYKTKIRNKSLVSNEEFDQKLHYATSIDI